MYASANAGTRVIRIAKAGDTRSCALSEALPNAAENGQLRHWRFLLVLLYRFPKIRRKPICRRAQAQEQALDIDRLALEMKAVSMNGAHPGFVAALVPARCSKFVHQNQLLVSPFAYSGAATARNASRAAIQLDANCA